MLLQKIVEAFGKSSVDDVPVIGQRVSKHRQRGSQGKAHPRSRVAQHFAQMDALNARRGGA